MKTRVHAVSISKEFRKMMKKYKISPSEAIRKGLAIEFYLKGDKAFQNKLLAERGKILFILGYFKLIEEYRRAVEGGR